MLYSEGICIFQQHRPVIVQRQPGIFNIPVSASAFIENEIKIITLTRVISEPEVCHYCIFSAVVLNESA